jgi:hypothetical protein
MYILNDKKKNATQATNQHLTTTEKIDLTSNPALSAQS